MCIDGRSICNVRVGEGERDIRCEILPELPVDLGPLFHPPTQETTALAVEECVTPGGIASAMHPHASADFADWRMTHRSLGACAPKRFSAQGRRWVGLLGTTGLPVGMP